MLTGLLNVKQVIDEKVPFNYSCWMAIGGLAICMIEMISVSVFLKCYQKRLDEDMPKKRCGYIYTELNY